LLFSKNICGQGAISLKVFMEENTVDPKLIIDKVAEDEEIFQHVNNPIIGIKPIQKKYLGIPNHADQIGNKFFFTDGEAKVEIVVVTDEIIRVRLAPHGVFLDEFSYAVPKLSIKATAFTLFESDTEFRVSTGVINCHIRKQDFFISFSDS
jgi:alpha-glucosidase